MPDDANVERRAGLQWLRFAKARHDRLIDYSSLRPKTHRQLFESFRLEDYNSGREIE